MLSLKVITCNIIRPCAQKTALLHTRYIVSSSRTGFLININVSVSAKRVEFIIQVIEVCQKHL
jgi:hypothetical protein